MNRHTDTDARLAGRIHGRTGRISIAFGMRSLIVTASFTGALTVWVPSGTAAQATCPQAAQSGVTSGWEQYRRNDMKGAASSFRDAQRACPSEEGPLIGLGYVDLRNGNLASAKRRLDAVVAREPDNTDALVGRGIIAWRENDAPRARTLFQHVRTLDPGNADAREYLAKLPAADVVPVREELVLSDTTVYTARTNGDHFEIRSDAGWRPFYIKGMNLGAALPGKNPSEFPDSAVYARWIQQMSDMGVNVVRVYTIHPPHFYQALAAFNRAHPSSPLWLVHGVWTELPPKGNFDDAPWKNGFFDEMRHVVDVLHGRSDIGSRPGHASGHYTADVSPWVLAYIIGREWEPYAIAQFNAMSKRAGWHGTYLETEGGTRADAWMAEACETIVAYEMKRYHAQRPVAYTNWPTLDPLQHPTETTVAQEVAIRHSQGEVVTVMPKEYDNDKYQLDATLVHATKSFPAGWFASYHAYPYYPDFLVYDTVYAHAHSSEGASSYFGYLTVLKQYHKNMPVVISEYGVPASIGIAHVQPQGWNHGGLTEAMMAAADARLTREIAESGMAGGMLFAWIDEWFKKNWIVIDYEIPQDRTRVWHNRLDAEQHYGMIAMDAKAPIAGVTLSDRLSGWRGTKALYSGRGTLRAASDESYLWLLYEPEPGQKPRDIMLGLDILDRSRGDTRWPGKVGNPLPVGLEFVLHAHGDSVQILADQAANPWKLYDMKPARLPRQLSAPLPDTGRGYFRGRVEMRLNPTVGSATNSDGIYSPLIVVPNRRRFTRDSSEILALGYDRGLLPHGNAPDGLWERLDDGTLEVRIPWMLINFTDPSTRRVLDNLGKGEPNEPATSNVDGIRVVARVTSASGEIATWPSLAGAAPAQYTWPTWEQPKWTERRRGVFDAMRAAFASLNPVVIR